MECAAGATCTIHNCLNGNCNIGCQAGATCLIEKCAGGSCNDHATYTAPSAQ
jgi:hypothetical protein